jgi:hypothetical protein
MEYEEVYKTYKEAKERAIKLLKEDDCLDLKIRKKRNEQLWMIFWSGVHGIYPKLIKADKEESEVNTYDE